MMKSIRRLSAGLLAGVLALTLAACGGDTNSSEAENNNSSVSVNAKALEPVMTVNGQEIDAGFYAASYLYSKANIENMMRQYGVSDLWTGEMGETYKEQLREVTDNQVVALCLVPGQFEAAGLELTDEERANFGTLSEDFAAAGFTEDLYQQYAEYYAELEKLDAYYFGENGTMAPEESEIESYYQEHYMRAKHVLISTMDESNQEITDEETLQQLEAKAQDIYQRAINGEDFDALVNEYGEDPGFSSYPDGYVFTDGEMIVEFEDAVKALEVNSISAPVKSSYGWHIIQRLPLRAEDRPAVFSAIVQSITGMDMNSLLNQWIGEAEVAREPLLDEITFDNVEDYKYNAE